MSVRLDPAAAGDIDAVMAVMATAFDPGFGEAWSQAQVLGSLATGTAWARVARDAAIPLGFTLCRDVGGEAELLLIGVAPAARRRGIGAALLTAAVRDAAERGDTALFLEVRDGNAAALALYRAAGFAIVGRRPAYYRGAGGDRFDALTLRRRLGDWDRDR
ncbi:MAG: GNAT family N-acetyltransferase [Sphingomonadaceae bacterium]|nr:GNAT family N-acetyltransferase [Sphingomonadaceae bacterium]